ncbi:putative late blight resistance protein homolog R1B-16 [Daucus carota subsp. sativus]|uniref:putative late blight resistance protein homolog R1B-16 n=1 Tax=Daucus carota subsp. sativus TaxID=79200 RepID=UPI0030833F0F
MEVNKLLQQLVSNTKKQLEVISIVGMAGLGKTTLAKRLYNDPYVVSYFYVQAWATCSQVYHKRDLLLSILRSVTKIADYVCKKNENMLAHDLYCALKGRRYLIVIDDLWSNKAWDDLKRCFPDDNNGSKIMLTTRLKDVALHAQSKGSPLSLRFLTEEESLDLFKQKACITGPFFEYLNLTGKSITRKCRGLPLAVVVIAGILKNNLEMDWWAQVEKSISSYIVSHENQYMNTLALSYNYLPQHLRPCLLTFGAFPEDHEIPVHKLIWIWIGEGFIHQNGTKKILEDIAEDYLTDLMWRSLVVVGKKGSNGAIKTCRIHDLLRDLCLKKAEEDHFPPNIYRYNKHCYSCPHSSTNLSSDCTCLSSKVSQSFSKDLSMICDTSKHIRSLDISSIELFVFPSEVLQLVHLRYLELRFRSGNPPESISCLRELQTLIMSSRMNMVVPNNMWKIINLRHLCIKSGENLVKSSDVEEEPSLLENLQTMSLVSPTRPFQHILARTPNLKKLGLCGQLTTNSGDLQFPDLGLLMHLKALKLLNTIPLCKAGRLSDSIIFPKSLTSLSLSNTYLDWSEAWAFEMIPNLEVLKLKFHAFVGKDWETSLGAFPRLKFLKLDELDIVTWTASRDHFPVLQCLQVHRCSNLLMIPEDFGNICTLEWIEFSECSDDAANSATYMQKEQEKNGNDFLKILHNPGETSSYTNTEYSSLLIRRSCKVLALCLYSMLSPFELDNTENMGEENNNHNNYDNGNNNEEENVFDLLAQTPSGLVISY